MFNRLETAPPDPILGLTEAFKLETNPRKINLGAGVFKDADDRTPVLATVKAAEARILEAEKSKGYLPIPGAPEFSAAVQEMIFGPGHEVVARGRAATAHTPGGTGALRVAGDFIHAHFPTARIWMSEPTWANHPAIFKAAGLEVATYPYYDYAKKGLDFEALCGALEKIPQGDVVLLHGCCHNPSGMDPDLSQWRRIGEILHGRGLLPLVDFAYQGFGDGLEEDAAGLRALCAPGTEMLVCSSFSKNFGLYGERCGGLTVVAENADALDRAFSNVKVCIRANYSNPPIHGGAIIATILSDPGLRAQWEVELAAMRDRIRSMRALFVETLKAKGVKEDYSFITRQKGMFSFSGLSKDQVGILREKYAIYIVGSGRINVAGMTEKNMDALCDAIAAVL